MKKESKEMPATRRDLPATNGLVYEVRDELKAEVRALDHKMEAGFEKMQAQFGSLQGDVRSLQGDLKSLQVDVKSLQVGFSSLRGEMSSLREKVELTLASVHRSQAIAEEQRSENRIMYETLLGMNQRMSRVEARQDQIDVTIRGFSKKEN